MREKKQESTGMRLCPNCPGALHSPQHCPKNEAGYVAPTRAESAEPDAAATVATAEHQKSVCDYTWSDVENSLELGPYHLLNLLEQFNISAELEDQIVKAFPDLLARWGAAMQRDPDAKNDFPRHLRRLRTHIETKEPRLAEKLQAAGMKLEL